MCVRHLSAIGRLRALILAVIASPTVGAGCAEIGPGGAEAKLGVGPFKLYGAEVGPGGAEVKGPSAGPFKALD